MVTAAAEYVGTYEQGTPEWHAVRKPAVTASEIAAVLGLSPFESAFSLYWRKIGMLNDQIDNDAMSLGRWCEPWVADRYADNHPDLAVRTTGTWRNRERPWQVVNPDRLLFEQESGPHGHGYALNGDLHPTSLLEIKTSGTYDGWGQDGSDDAPAYYRAQVLWQLDTFGLTDGRLACLFLANRQIREYTIRYDPADVDVMRTAAREFLDRIARQDPPPIDDQPATTAALKALHPDVDDREQQVGDDLALRYENACAEQAMANLHKREVENEVRAALGDARWAVLDGGQKVATRSVYERAGMDTRRFRADHPNLWSEYQTTSTIDRLTPARRTNQEENTTP